MTALIHPPEVIRLQLITPTHAKPGRVASNNHDTCRSREGRGGRRRADGCGGGRACAHGSVRASRSDPFNSPRFAFIKYNIAVYVYITLNLLRRYGATSVLGFLGTSSSEAKYARNILTGLRGQKGTLIVSSCPSICLSACPRLETLGTRKLQEDFGTLIIGKGVQGRGRSRRPPPAAPAEGGSTPGSILQRGRCTRSPRPVTFEPNGSSTDVSSHVKAVHRVFIAPSLATVYNWFNVEDNISAVRFMIGD
ncbi:hypothetical protein EVAR_11556_1 [Eumeta japonica]|uniref:Uncharacterized protein n=1 Tax=Eumeta variegata TaxID=151549 RepID=A0A4C1TYT7_EUMVA|nr:hypothetical protein EVAR_11556_1 [Eumeta japonica]